MVATVGITQWPIDPHLCTTASFLDIQRQVQGQDRSILTRQREEFQRVLAMGYQTFCLPLASDQISRQ